MILIHRPGAFPTRSARLLGLLHLGMYDAMMAALDSRGAYKRKPPFRVDRRIERLAKSKDRSYPDINAAIAGAAEEILAYVFPQETPSTFTRLADQATSSRVWAGVAYPSDVVQGRLIGQQVAKVVIAYGESDGHKNPPGPILATRLCDPTDCTDPNQRNWVPTPFHYQYPPTDPAATTWNTYLLSSPSQFRPPLPHAYGSPEFCAQLKEVYDTNNTADDSQRQLAFFWDDGPGTYSPAGHWNDIAVDVLRNRRLGTERAAFIFAVMNAAIVDAFIAVWDAKYAHWTQRPVTAIRERPLVCSGQVHDPGWLPNIVTPPFPAFPSGHSAESAAAARVLQYFFPDKGQDPNTLVGNYGTAGSFDAVADEVAFSRMVGGIHFRADNEVGLVLGRRIADLAIGWINVNGVSPENKPPARWVKSAQPLLAGTRGGERGTAGRGVGDPAPPGDNGSTPIIINDNSAATPYPSQLEISGFGSSVEDVNVRLDGLSHGYSDDIDAVLVGPSGQSAAVMSDVGGDFAVNNVSLTLDDEATTALPDQTQIASGTFQPTDSDSIGWEPDVMPAPAPTPTIASLSIFEGANPNGPWRLFIYDDTPGEQGLLNGWSLEILTSGPAVQVSKARVNEGRAARFKLTRSLNLGGSTTVSFTTVNGSAKAGRDFRKVSGTTTFASQETTKTVIVRTKNDNWDEPNEKFSLRVTSGGTTTEGSAKIVDND